MSAMTIIAGDPAKAMPLTPQQAEVLKSLHIAQWPAVAPIYAETLARAHREAVAAVPAETMQGVSESVLRFADTQYRECPKARAILNAEVLGRELEAQAEDAAEVDAA